VLRGPGNHLPEVEHAVHSGSIDMHRPLSWDDVPAELVLPGIERRVIHGARQTMVRYLYAPGSVFPVHAHPQEQITLVIRGRIRFDLVGESVELGPGDVAIIPGDTPHGAEVVGEEEVETYNALSPRREEDPLRD
jgi:quercetin dioxygenase-like cupin family protein